MTDDFTGKVSGIASQEQNRVGPLLDFKIFFLNDSKNFNSTIQAAVALMYESNDQSGKDVQHDFAAQGYFEFNMGGMKDGDDWLSLAFSASFTDTQVKKVVSGVISPGWSLADVLNIYGPDKNTADSELVTTFFTHNISNPAMVDGEGNPTTMNLDRWRVEPQVVLPIVKGGKLLDSHAVSLGIAGMFGAESTEFGNTEAEYLDGGVGPQLDIGGILVGKYLYLFRDAETVVNPPGDFFPTKTENSSSNGHGVDAVLNLNPLFDYLGLDEHNLSAVGSWRRFDGYGDAFVITVNYRIEIPGL